MSLTNIHWSSSDKNPVSNRYDPKKVFIVHGKDEVAKSELANILNQLQLEPIILHEQPNKGRTLIEKFEQHAATAGYAFVLITPDDACSKSNEIVEHRARQNVILELGYFMGKLGRERVCCLYKKGVNIPTDIHRIAYLEYQTTINERLSAIRTELMNAGYIVN